MDFHHVSIAIVKAFTYHNEWKKHSSIDYISSGESIGKFMNDLSFREKFEKKEAEITLYDN
ncbi:hypothetical protein [Caldiplasma sukawensis]